MRFNDFNSSNYLIRDKNHVTFPDWGTSYMPIVHWTEFFAPNILIASEHI